MCQCHVFVLCVFFLHVLFCCRMANIDEFGFQGEGFDQEEEMDVAELVKHGIIDVQTSESEQEDLGEDL